MITMDQYMDVVHYLEILLDALRVRDLTESEAVQFDDCWDFAEFWETKL